VILLCGIPSEAPLAMVRAQLEDLNTPCVTFNQRRVSRVGMEFLIEAGRVTGSLELEGRSYRLEHFDGIYTRLMDDRFLPELRNEEPQSPAQLHSRRIHDVLFRWCEVAPARVVNRAGPMGSNCSKPYQAQLIAAEGFFVPETLITNDPELVIEFLKGHKAVVYKSMSGVRSIVQKLESKDLEHLDRIRWCPVQFQEFVEGTDVRVHTVGGEVFATAIQSSAADYRYASQHGGTAARLRPFDISDDLADRCLALSRSLGLAFAGIDLKLTPDDRAFCFEVNPSPGFSYYEANTGQPIAAAVARYITGRSNST
jgi:glutathione synthase/RimK-type ligase-like ATP-grasp enzyme